MKTTKTARIFIKNHHQQFSLLLSNNQWSMP